MYRTYIRPILTYAGTVILNCADAHFKKLQTTQNKCLRMALVKPYYTKISELHKDSKIPYIKDFVTKNAEKFYYRATATI